jgi:hypothetical protein
MSYRQRLALRLRATAIDSWPDAYASLLAILGAVVVLINRNGAERVSIGRLLPGHWADIYLWLILLAAGALVIAIGRRRHLAASRAAVALSLLLSLNGAAVFIAYGSDSVFAACAYQMVAVLLMNRSYVLARGQVVPRWRADR